MNIVCEQTLGVCDTVQLFPLGECKDFALSPFQEKRQNLSRKLQHFVKDWIAFYVEKNTELELLTHLWKEEKSICKSGVEGGVRNFQFANGRHC